MTQTENLALTKHKPGTYLAKAVDWAVTKTKAGLGQACIVFRYEHGDLMWWGSFKDGAVDHTLDTLLLLGLNGPLESLAAGVEGKALNTTIAVEIVVEHHQNTNGKLYAGISWVNDPNRTRMERVTVMEAQTLLASANAILFQKRQAHSAQNPANGQTKLW